MECLSEGVFRRLLGKRRLLLLWLSRIDGIGSRLLKLLLFLIPEDLEGSLILGTTHLMSLLLRLLEVFHLQEPTLLVISSYLIR